MKKKCRVLDYTGERSPVLDAAKLLQEQIECLYLFGTWENMRKPLSVFSEQHTKGDKLRVVAVIYGQPCGDVTCVDRWFSLSQETMPAASVRAFLQTLHRSLNRQP